jgi:transcriptional antiterminator NusG
MSEKKEDITLDNENEVINDAVDKTHEDTINKVVNDNGKLWYVVQVQSGFENRVKENLLERIKLAEQQELFGDILIPTEEVVEMKAGGQKRRSERKFFPGYILVNMVMSDENWHLVRKTPRVSGFIGGTSSKPSPISNREVDSILRQVEDGAEKPRPKIIFEAGEVIRVIDGPFADFTGVVEEVDYEKSRLKVAVLIFGRSTSVDDMRFDQVEKG